MLVIDEAGDAHVRLRDASLVPGFQHFSHVLELALLVTSSRRDPVIEHTQQRVNVLAGRLGITSGPWIRGKPDSRRAGTDTRMQERGRN
jgi:hypothetical protein